MHPLPDKCKELVESFSANRATYMNMAFPEMELRSIFLDHFWRALGWPVGEPLSSTVCCVRLEPSIRDESGKKNRADYSFMLDGRQCFFLEAKKPAINLNIDPKPALQIRKYGWNATLPINVLSDFEELAIYDCRFEPHDTDRAEVGRIKFFTFDQYEDQWDDIYNLFSKEAVAAGSLKKFEKIQRSEQGTETVDKRLLKDIEEWRVKLAECLHKNHPDYGVKELNYAVQMTIDRLLFLRMCEDRGIEKWERLKHLLGEPDIYTGLFKIFREADDKYNSGLFHFKKELERDESPDGFTPNLRIDNLTLATIIEGLYEPRCHYAFNLIPLEILGQVYEQFLGKKIIIDDEHGLRIEEKPEVRKAGGVYYTPQDIVSYIVKNTVGKLLSGKTPKEASCLRILDPACGSGSFLLGAFREICEWHLKWYISDQAKTGRVPTSPPPEGKRRTKKDPPAIYMAKQGEWSLTTAEKKRIIMNNLYGVDIDPEAVEVTKLSLMLNVLEDESYGTFNEQLKLFYERALPDLTANIKCGNSLIDSNYFAGISIDEEEERWRIRPFDWDNSKYGFGEIMKAGGFDAVIGNPPYLKIEHISEGEREYFFHNYFSCIKRFDTYGLFIEKALSLLADNKYCSMIIPSTILNNQTFKKLRKLLLESTSIEAIVNLGGKIFLKVNNDTLIFVFFKGCIEGKKTDLYDVANYGSGLSAAHKIGEIDFVMTAKSPNHEFQIRLSSIDSATLDKVEKISIPLREICKCFQGFVTGSNEAYIIEKNKAIEEQNK